MEINTNRSVSEKEAQIYKRFKNLSVSEEILPQGDANIKISPFDDYFLFTIYSDERGEDVPVDLSNVGTLFISFIGENDEIKIPNYTNVQELDMSAGQVLFRITKENGKKILALDNNNFYISSHMKGIDGSESDETVIYTGTFSTLTEAAKRSLSSEIDNLRSEASKEIATQETENDRLKSEVESLKQAISEMELTMDALTRSNNELSNELDDLTKESKSQSIKEAQQNAKDAQALSAATKKLIKQNKILRASISTNGASKSIIDNAAKGLQSYS